MSIVDEMKKQAILRNAAPVHLTSNPLVRQVAPSFEAAAAPSRPLIQALTQPSATPNPRQSALAQNDPTSPAMRDPANPMKPEQGASAALATPPRQITAGAFRSGSSFGYTAASATEGTRPAPVSAQNMAAADALASRYSGPGMTAQPQAQPTGPQNLTPKTSGSGYGLLDQGYRDRRAAMMDAQQFKPGARTALAALLKEQTLANDRTAESEQNEAKMGFQRGENAMDRDLKAQDLMVRREDAAANRGLKAQELADNALVNAAKRDAINTETSAAKRLASLQDAYMDAETDADRSTAAQRLAQFRGLSGPTQPAPAGFRWSANGQSLEAIPGGPAAIKQNEDQRTRDSAHDQTRQTIGTINRLMEHPGRKGATGTWNLGRMVPGSSAADFAAEVETLKAQTFLPMVQQLRGMGALSNAEGEKLNAAVGALRFDMSEKAFNESLARIREQFGAALGRSGVDIKDMQSWGLNPDQGQQASPQPQEGQQRAIKRTGTLNGRRVVEYADGSINYAD
ncbi:MAG: hypothetical protein PWQ61_1591 [Betaproteobacteria bacterium]|nr:hypothetical protein [Betaproteobacteria bacterium]